jgi:iron only hydrogenase large subunit-like protein
MSAILSADTLNDFIAPSVACIKPVETLPAPPPSNELAVSVESDKLSPNDAKTAAQISLTDCLACSGCVTSSEAVLVSMQSHNEVLDVLSRHYGDKKFVALLSPQTRAALAVAVGVGGGEAGNMASDLLYRLGFEWVVDTNPFRKISLHYAAEEVVGTGDEEERKNKPVLASSCPGFICYLESTHPELIPHLSNLKSPQAIAGTFIKAMMVGEGKIKGPGEVYVVAVMPCFDKKLEGARGELTSTAWKGELEGEPVRDVDCVITTRELLLLAEARGVRFSAMRRTPLPVPLISSDPAIQAFLTAPAPNGPNSVGSSGGSLMHIISTLITKHPDATLRIQQGRNVDTLDYTLVSPSGETVAKLSRCYGFRNIQNLVRRLKPPKVKTLPRLGGSKGSGAAALTPTAGTAAAARRVAAKRVGAGIHDKALYVEVMACPGGCTNGGGQPKWDDNALWKELEMEPASHRELLAKVDEAYYSANEDDDDALPLGGMSVQLMRRMQREQEEVVDIVQRWSKIAGVAEDKLIRTTYRKVANDIGNRLGEKEVLEMASRNGGGW